MSFSFRCASCGQTHEGMPAFGASAPLDYYAIPKAERADRCQLSDDDCIIDGKHFFIRGCLDIPVRGQAERFSWGVWVELSEPDYAEWVKCYESPTRAQAGPFYGWLNAWLKPYPDTMDLKTRAHLRDHGLRPLIELEPTEHPLAVEQREGISVARVAEIYALMVHQSDS